MSEATRREVIEAAWDKAEKDEQTELEGKAGANTDAQQSEEKQTEETTEVSAQEKTPVESKQQSEDSYTTEKKAAEAREQPEQHQQISDKPPVSWKPAQREQWGKLPPDVRAEINRRERQIQETLTQTDNVRKFANDFAQIVQPYAHLIRQRNATPLQAVQNLMATNARLINGSAEEKAQTVANIIGEFGIDVQVLDNILSKVVKDGKVPSPQTEQLPAWARPMFDFMGEVRQSREAALERSRQEAAREVEKISEKPFFEDLREDMADIMEVATRRGREITLEEAYKQAVALRPDISAIVAQREKARNPVSEAAATLARARRAASTVSGAPTGAKVDGKPTPKTRRNQIAAAWEDQEAGG